MEENDNIEDVEAIPGPTFEITRETYEKMQKNNNSYKQENDEFFKRVFNNIKMETENEEN